MTYVFRCRDAGAAACGAVIEAESEEEMKAKLVEHVDRYHDVPNVNDTLVDHLLAVSEEK